MTWEIGPHTKAKHVILENYLNAWFPIMAFSNPRIVYIDGFAGPGRYKKGEDGSPIKALKIAKTLAENHPSKVRDKEFVFIFVEANKNFYESLCEEISQIKLPENFIVMPKNGEFSDVMEEIFDYLRKNNAILAPTFAFIDPFGTKGVPFEVVKQIMSYPKCEVLFNHMYFGVIRSAHITDHTELYGTNEWENYINIPSPEEKHSKLTGLYVKQLKEKANVKYVRSFNVRNRKNVTLFDLIYATNHIQGLAKMKEAMWKADPSGNFTFRDNTNPDQLVLFKDEPDFSILRDQLLKKYKGKTVTIDEIENYVLVETAFLRSHIRQKNLLPMEREGLITISRPPGSRRNGIPKGSLITFPA